MSFLLPGFLAAAGAIASAVVILHFIVSREPDLLRLPTARFAPERAIQARARALEPSDLLLLAIRVALVLAAGAALAGPVVSPPRRDLIRIVLLDRSRGAVNVREAVDSARGLLGPRDILILFDSAATVVASDAADSLSSLSLSERQGRLSTALISGLRSASQVRNQADSIELVVISPLAAEEIDAATDSLRSLWPAQIRFIRTTARSDSAAPVVTFDGSLEDPLRLALPVASAVPGVGATRLIRRLASTADSVWAAGAGHVLVVWPASREIPEGWAPRAGDTVGAVVAGRVVVVAPFTRRLSSGPRTDRVVARWVDGAPAAVETARGDGCIRTVTIEVPAIGDLVLERRFAQLVASLTGPCGGETASAPLDDVTMARLAGSSGSRRAPAAGFAKPAQTSSPWARWLLLLAAVLAAAEMLLRRRIAR